MTSRIIMLLYYLNIKLYLNRTLWYPEDGIGNFIFISNIICNLIMVLFVHKGSVRVRVGVCLERKLKWKVSGINMMN